MKELRLYFIDVMVYVTLDVTLLYTQIGNKQGQHAAKEALGEFQAKNPNVKSSNELLIHLLLILSL